MADSEKVIKLKIEVAEAQANANIKKLQKSLEKLDGRTKEYTLTTRKLRLERQKLSDLRSQMTASNQQMTASMKESTSATGASTAASLELGRVFSDMPYGIRGVANNISQLASNVFFMSRKTDEVTGKVVGFGGALKSIGTSLLGPAGVLVAFQLIVAIFEKLSMSSDKLKNTLSELQAESFTQNVVKLSLLKQAVNDSSISMEKKAEAVKAAAGEFKELNKVVKDGSVNVGEFNKTVDAMIEEMKKVALAKAILAETQDVMRDIVKQMIKGPEGAFDSFDGFLSAITDIANPSLVNGATSALKYSKKIGELAKEYDKLYQMLKDQDLFKFMSGGNKGTADKRMKEFKSRMLDFTREILAFNKRQEETEVNTQSDLNEIKRSYEREELNRKHKSFVEKQELRLKEYKNRVKDAKNANELIEKAQKLHDDSMLESQSNYNDALTALKRAQSDESLKIQRELNEETESLALKNKQTLEDIEFEEQSMSRISKGFRTGKRGESAIRARRDEEEGNEMAWKAQMQVQIIENQLNNEIMTDEKRAELLLEKERREEEYLEGVKLRSKAAMTIEKIELDAKKQALSDLSSLLNSASQIANANSREGKMLAIASTTISTYAAAQDAYESQIIAGDPSSVPRAVLAAAASVAAGLARVKQIMAVKLPKGDVKGSAPQQGREFDFNLVGSTAQNQLAEGIAGQFGQPIQAYVVSTQMSSQQQLDNIIQSSATLGDDGDD